MTPLSGSHISTMQSATTNTSSGDPECWSQDRRPPYGTWVFTLWRSASDARRTLCLVHLPDHEIVRSNAEICPGGGSFPYVFRRVAPVLAKIQRCKAPVLTPPGDGESMARGNMV